MISTAHAASAEAAHAVPWYAAPETYVALAFFIVVGMAIYFGVHRALIAGLDGRRERIKNRIDEAHRLREDAQETLALYQRKQRDALKEAEEIIAHAKSEAARMAERAAQDLDEALKRREQQALDRIAQAEAEALKEVRNLAVDIAMAATRRLIAETLSAKQAAGMVDRSIKELPGKLH